MTMATTCLSGETAVAGRAIQPRGEFHTGLTQHHRVLLTYALMLTSDRALAEDLVQETMLRALRAADRFEAGTNMRGWLTRILRNLFTDQCRHRGIVREVSVDELPLSVPPIEEVRAPSYLDALSTEDVRSAMLELSADLRVVFELYADNASYAEIADRLHLRLSTVGTRLFRARSKLRAILQRRWLARASGCPGEMGPMPPRRNDVVSSPRDDNAWEYSARIAEKGVAVLGA